MWRPSLAASLDSLYLTLTHTTALPSIGKGMARLFMALENHSSACLLRGTGGLLPVSREVLPFSLSMTSGGKRPRRLSGMGKSPPLSSLSFDIVCTLKFGVYKKDNFTRYIRTGYVKIITKDIHLCLFCLQSSVEAHSPPALSWRVKNKAYHGVMDGFG